MKRLPVFPFLMLLFSFAVAMTGCTRGGADEAAGDYGTLDISSITVSTQQAATRAEGDVDTSDFVIRICDSGGDPVDEWTPDSPPSGKYWLKKGTYTLEIYSPTPPAAGWDTPWYGGSAEFEIVPDEETSIAPIPCTLQNIKVTVQYDEVLQALLPDKDHTNVTVSIDGNTLVFPYGETRGGYFRAEDTTSMTVSFDGMVGSLPMSMPETVEVGPGEWKRIAFGVDPDDWTFRISVSGDGTGQEDSEIGQIGDGTPWF